MNISWNNIELQPAPDTKRPIDSGGGGEKNES